MSGTIIISTEKLKEMIQTSILTTSKEKNNILLNTMIKIKGKIIEISSKNTITKSKQTIEIQDTNEINTFLVNPHTLFNILKELEEKDTEISTKERIIQIKNGKFKTTLKTIDQNLYPEETLVEKELIGTVDFKKLKHLIKSAIPYPDRNDISREYTGVFIEMDKGLIKATSTDHFRLINIETKTENTDINENFIIENEGGMLISKIDMDSKVEFYKNRCLIEFKDNKKTIESKIIQGDYPNYEAILLNESDNKIVLNKEEFLSSVKRVAITNDNNEIELKAETGSNMLNIFSKNQEGEESSDEIEIRKTAAESALKIKLNARFLIEFLTQMSVQDIQLLYRSSQEPIMLKCQDEQYTYNYIMTPMTD